MTTVNATGNGLARAWLAVPERMRNIALVAVLVAGLLLLPFGMRAAEKTYSLSLIFSLNVALLYVVLALGLNIVVGFAGLLDLGYAAFFALGAYAFGVFTWPVHGLEWSFWIVILLVGPIAAFFGLIIGAPTLRLRGDYLAIVTLAFGEIVPNALRNFSDIHIPWLGLDHFNLTNGTQGLKPVGRPIINMRFWGLFPNVEPFVLGSAKPVELAVNLQAIFPNMEPLTIAQLNSQMLWYYVVLVIGALVLLGSRRLDESRLGRAWKAIREDETAADCMGVNPVRTKLLAFALGASFSGFAGAVFASMSQAVFPELFRFNVSVFILIIVIISGMGNVWGVLVGGLIITLFDRVLLAQIAPQFLDQMAEQTGSAFLAGIDLQLYRWVMFGAGLLIIMLLRPEGLFPSKARKALLHEHDIDQAEADEHKAAAAAHRSARAVEDAAAGGSD
jgi:branched-chain amino acid transport system permease protein